MKSDTLLMLTAVNQMKTPYYNKTEEWRNEPISDKQIEFLKALNYGQDIAYPYYDYVDDEGYPIRYYSKGKASDILDILSSVPSGSQKEMLENLNYSWKEIDNMNRKEASLAIDKALESNLPENRKPKISDIDKKITEW